jgi:hypothetical protein
LERLLRIFIHPPKVGGVSTTDAIKDTIPEKLQVFPRYVIDEDVKPETEIAIGHLRFGCHHAIHNLEDFEIRYLTQLRNPVDRVFSHWAYLQRQGRMDMGLFEFMESSRVIAENLQVRQLAGMPHSEPVNTAVPVAGKDLRQAKYNLAQHFDWVGVLDHYPASIARLSLLLGVDLPIYRHNVWTHKREIEADERAAIEEGNRYDTELYQWVLEKYYPGG